MRLVRRCLGRLRDGFVEWDFGGTGVWVGYRMGRFGFHGCLYTLAIFFDMEVLLANSIAWQTRGGGFDVLVDSIPTTYDGSMNAMHAVN